ncbi:S28 family serine protease [Maribellus sediminis]|uniref:S28 family serine protease n=1 Tax=Maribellus sediminis TaxID=2696285 RepID=UPI0014309567|nr:S28 family serine protease [Maribellus sediminis]
MKRFQLLLLLLLLSTFVFAQYPSLEAFLKEQPQVKSIEKLETNDFFNEKYKIMVEQPLDHRHPKKGTFLQRVIICNKGVDRPVVFITEGYNGGYAENPRYINELSPILEANQICMDHRYFGESMPDPLNWDYLTVRNAAADHHEVIQMMKKYYEEKWITTGISKGGQTVVYHRWLYPDDVDVSIPYVAPLNFAVEDGRHEPFIANVTGTAEGRKKVRDLQLYVVKHRDEFVPMLKDYCEEKKLHSRLEPEEMLDFVVLEYSYGFWQYGTPIDAIPATDAGDDVIFEHLVKISSPMYLSDEGVNIFLSFYIQAARELGYYGYDTEPFKDYLRIKSAEGWMTKIYLPKDLKVKYQPKTALAVKKFIDTTDSRILFIYGEWDPWSASAFEVPQKDNFLKIVKPEGSHNARIGNLPEDQKALVKAKLEEWLEMKK